MAQARNVACALPGAGELAGVKASYWIAEA